MNTILIVVLFIVTANHGALDLFKDCVIFDGKCERKGRCGLISFRTVAALGGGGRVTFLDETLPCVINLILAGS
jgi:hypothetical protein